MFDARSILEILVGGGPRQAASGQGAERREPPGSPEATSQPGSSGGGTSLDDLLHSLLAQIQQRQGPAGGPQAAPDGEAGLAAGPEVGKELRDLLRQILRGTLGGNGQRASSAAAAQAPRLGGDDETSKPSDTRGLAQALSQVLSQAAAGVQEGAARIGETTGLSGKVRDALAEATGRTPEELVGRMRQLMGENQLAAGAALGGLGALVLGTSAGRSLAAAAIKLGGLALIGGLAYKAYQSYQQGKAPLVAEDAEPQSLIPAPEGSGFEAGAVTNDAARRCVRAMIAAAAADGRIDAEEQHRILGGLRQAGLDDAAQQFLAAEITSPASVAELASGISSLEEALQVYTAARVAVGSDNAEEHVFLSALADALGIDDALAAQVDAAARLAAA